MASRMTRSPGLKRKFASVATSPRFIMTRMPRNDSAMPAICRGVTRSRSSAQATRRMKSGDAEFISTPFTDVVKRSPV